MNQTHDALIAELKAVHPDIKPISTSIIVVADWVRLKCRYGCKGYGRHLCCPPYAPTPDETRRVLSEYRNAVLARFETEPNPELLPGHTHHAMWGPVTKMHHTMFELERRAFLCGCYRAFAMGAMPCTLCETCVIEEKLNRNETVSELDTLKCRHKDIMRPSVEACGIDVFKTLENAGFSSKVITDYSQKVELFGLVLLD
jgi:predicted metal-binding protein